MNLNDKSRVRKAKKIGKLKEEYKQLDGRFCSEADNRKKIKLSGQISKLSEQNKIASEKNKQIKINKSRTNINFQSNNGIHNTNNFKFNKSNKKRKK